MLHWNGRGHAGACHQGAGYVHGLPATRAAKSVADNGIHVTDLTGFRRTTFAQPVRFVFPVKINLFKVRLGEIADFRMIIRGQQRTTHSDSQTVSGRARELAEKGFYFLKYNPKGSKPGDVWDILPEDTQSRELHFAPYPEDLCKIPILATCPENGIVLDPFCGTGTTTLVARTLFRKSVGIDISMDYLNLAEQRCMRLL